MQPAQIEPRQRGQGACRIGRVVVAASLLSAACSDDSGTAPAPTTTVAPATTTVPDDGILRIGMLAPLSGPGAAIGTSMRDAAELAVTEINENGGVSGRAVRLIVQDEGDSTATASVGLDQLVTTGIDSLVGPASSIVALDLLPTAVQAGVLTCSPTATAMSLDGFPDGGLFIRTIPSDTLQAEAIARAVEQTGRASVSVLYLDDAYGRPFAERLATDLSARAISVTDLIDLDGSDLDFADEAAEASASGAEVIAIVGDSATGPRVLRAVLDSDADPTVPIVVNDAMLAASATNAYAGLDRTDRSRVTGVMPRATSDNQTFTDQLIARAPETPGFFAANTVDCINLIALAATAADSTRASDFAGRAQSVSTGGTRCDTFARCKDALDQGRNIDYDGPSGQLQLLSTGDPGRGVFDLVGLDDLGRTTFISTIIVTV